MSDRPEIVADDGNRCGESPIWDAAGQRFLWSDIDGGRVFELHPASGRKRVIYDGGLHVSALALHESGALVFACHEGLHVFRDGAGTRMLHTQHGDETLVCNDMRADAAGRLYFGTLHWGADGKMERTGTLYLLDLDGGLRAVDEGITLSNGLGFSGDGRTLYFADSSVRRIYAYDVDVTSGALAHRRVFVQLGLDEGLPDGLCVDSADHIWCAHWYGAAVVRYTPDGQVDRRIALPVSQTSSCAFGGADLADLYITSASDLWTSGYFPRGFDPTAKPAGGALFRVRPGASGRPEFVARTRL